MWLFTPYFFVSVVQKPNEKLLTARARISADLDELRRRYLPSLSPTMSTLHADYQCRATCTHAALAQAMTKIVADTVYANFKSSVEREQGREREQVYAQVWSVLADGLPPLDKHQAARRTVAMPRVLRSRPRRSPRSG